MLTELLKVDTLHPKCSLVQSYIRFTKRTSDSCKICEIYIYISFYGYIRTRFHKIKKSTFFILFFYLPLAFDIINLCNKLIITKSILNW